MELLVRKKKRIALLLFVAGTVFLVTGVGIAGWWLMGRNAGSPTASTQQIKTDPKPVKITSNTLFTGNTFWGRYINDWSMASPLKTAYPFSRLKEFHREKYDAWVTGLECPTVANFSQTSAEEDSTLSFNCSPKYLPEFAKWFTIVTMANNHSDNRGAAGFAETRKHLEENGVQYFGHYDPEKLSDVCEVVSLPVKVTYDDNSTKERSLPIAMCGYHGVFKVPSEASLSVMEKYSEIMPVIAMPHMGVEYKPAPDELKTRTYRAMIDHGADMVLGDHPHWIQNTEAYKGKLIVYSMGNFIFDQQDTPDVVRSAAIRVLMGVKESDSALLDKWLALGDSCKAFHDKCLSTAQFEGLTKLPFTYRFGVVGTDDSNKIVKPANKTQQASILQRLDWARTMSQLQAPQSSL